MDLADLVPEQSHKPIAVADCETDPFKLGRSILKPFLWGWYNGEEYREFDTTAAFVAFIRTRDEILYAHNGGKFDWHFLLPEIDGLQDLGIINGRLSRFKVGACELRDSYNILPVSLSKWQKDEIDYSIFEVEERDKPENRKKIQAYLKTDCIYLFDMVSQFIAKYGMHLTQAGAALATWESMAKTKAPKSTAAYYDAHHRYYFGGRVECFQTGVKATKFRVADINSAYPRAMLDQHPFAPSSGTIRHLTAAQVLKWIDKKGAGLVFVSCRARSRGAFPFRTAGGSLFFPADNRLRVYHVTGWEFLAAMETGTADVVSVESIEVFEGGINFKDYILHFYELRDRAKKTGDKGGDLFSKLLMNSLYGKFASNPREYEHYINLPEEYAGIIGKPPTEGAPLDLAAHHFSGLLGPWALAARPLEETEMRFYNIATSASITGYVRAFLWRTLCATKGAIYCDTDSIAAAEYGQGIDFGDALGQWKDEGAFDKYAVGGRKLYAFRYATGQMAKDGTNLAGTWKTASKGVRLTADQVERVAAGEVIQFENDKPTFSIHHAPKIVNRKIRAVHRIITDEE